MSQGNGYVIIVYLHMFTKQNTNSKHFFFTLVKVHPGKKYSTMVMEATITRNNTQTTIVRAEGREHDLRQKEYLL